MNVELGDKVYIATDDMDDEPTALFVGKEPELVDGIWEGDVFIEFWDSGASMVKMPPRGKMWILEVKDEVQK